MRLLASSVLLAALAAGSAGAGCPAPSGVEIYPTSEVLPANLLRAYVYFPRRMGQGDILDHVALLDDRGREVEGAFLGNRYDLWSTDRTRLTLLLDPARVKTGLAAHDAMGRALDEGRSYRIVVRGTARDARGCAIGAETAQVFVAGAPDRDPPRPGDWSLSRPRSGTTEPLEVDLGSPHDHLSLAYRLRVQDGSGADVPGRIALGAGERVWSFAPAAPWPAEPHLLAVDPRLEDLAGNRPGALFDRPAGVPDNGAGMTLEWSPEPAED